MSIQDKSKLKDEIIIIQKKLMKIFEYSKIELDNNLLRDLEKVKKSLTVYLSQ